MTSTVNIDELTAIDLSLLCRGCLAMSGEMKNMVEWGLEDDFYLFTNVQVNTSDNPSLLLCLQCEDTLYKCRSFKVKCQQSDMCLKSAQEKKLNDSNNSICEEASNSKEIVTYNELSENRLIIKIIAHNMDSKIHFPCPYECNSSFLKRTDLLYHLIKQHRRGEEFSVDLQFYCPIAECSYNINSCKDKHFTGRKYLNQHTYKVHKEKINCSTCKLAFSNDVEYKRHLKTCNFIYVCQVCDIQFKTNEKLLIHLLRKHPDLHKQYKNNRKAEKRQAQHNTEVKRVKLDDEKTEYFCDSPKRSFATQTFKLEEHIRNDVTLPSWQAEKLDDTKKDEMSTQTVYEDLLSLKSTISEDDTIYADAVSLSDIQTQTGPLEFGLSRSNKETITSETQSPDLSIKETQTCFCLYDFPKPNFRCTDSVSSSPSNFSALTSTETQTLDLRGSLYSDVLSSCISTETQTCFDELNKDL